MHLGRSLAAAAAAFACHAGATTLDFESLQRGLQITTQLQAQGVLVSGIDTSRCCAPGTVIDVSAGDLGVFPFGGSGRQALVYGIAGDQLAFDFVLPGTTTPAPMAAVSLRVGDGDGPQEAFRVTFKGAGGQVLDVQQFVTGSGPVDGGVTVSFSGGGIQRVEVLGVPFATGGAVDDLSFTPAIPEPGTALLFAAGAGWLAWRRRALAR